MLDDTVGLERESLPRGRGVLVRAWPTLRRYALSTGGPLATSGAHFIASLILLRNLSPAEFGLFSFLLTVVPFSLSLAGALIAASFIGGLRRVGLIEEASLSTHLKANLVVSLLAFVAVSAAMIVSGAGLEEGLTFGLYGAAMVLRQFGRTHAYASERSFRPLASDSVYAALLILGLVLLLVTGTLSMPRAAAVLAGAALLSMVAFGRDYAARQIRPGNAGSLGDYRAHWQEFAGWAVLGVALTEFTANAHAYIVTFVAGPQAFALLAVGALVLRPASLVLSSLPDIERPRMARKIGAGDIEGAFRNVKEFRTAAGAIWLGTLVLAGVLLIWFPQVLLKKGYDPHAALAVIAIWGVILAVRTLRTPEAVLLQAAGEFKVLASASTWACVTSVAMTLVLLLAIGPVAALFGILAGDLVMTANIFVTMKRWRARHG
jgi:O-antigen/teichoic acid export membrane protein